MDCKGLTWITRTIEWQNVDYILAMCLWFRVNFFFSVLSVPVLLEATMALVHVQYESKKNVNKSTAVLKVVLLLYLYLKVLFEVPEVPTE